MYLCVSGLYLFVSGKFLKFKIHKDTFKMHFRYMYLSCIPVVPHEAVAEVSRRGKL